MKRLLHPALEISRLEMPRLGLPAFRLRILVRSVFVLLHRLAHAFVSSIDALSSLEDLPPAHGERPNCCRIVSK